MDPVPSPPHVFGLVGGRLIYARLEGGVAGRSLEAYHSVAIDPEVLGEGLLGGPVRDLDELRGVVGALLDDVGSPIPSASLVLPDAWLRLLFLESEVLPEEDERRLEVLRWKMKRMVPFRVEDLRINAVAVDPLPGQEEPCRYLVGFGSGSLIGGLETAFETHGVHCGRVTNESLATLSGIGKVAGGGGVTLLVLADGGGWSLVVARDGRPLLHRYKPQPEATSPNLRPLVERDLRLTITFVEEHFPDERVGRTLLLAARGLEDEWAGLLEGALERPTELVRAGHLGLEGDAPAALRELGPLVGVTWEAIS